MNDTSFGFVQWALDDRLNFVPICRLSQTPFLMTLSVASTSAKNLFV